MSCPTSPSKWWQDYVAGRLRTPQSIVSAAWNDQPDPAQASDRFFSIPEPGPRFDAPVRLSAPVFMRSEAAMKQRYRADWAHCDPRLMVFAATFVHMAARRNVPLYVHTALRSRAAQEAVKASGASRAAYGRSPHNIGEAVDVVHGVFHWDMNSEEWKFLYALGRLAEAHVNVSLKTQNKLVLTWGGNFRSLYDPAHWEIADFRSRPGVPPQTVPVRLSTDEILSRRFDLLRGL